MRFELSDFDFETKGCSISESHRMTNKSSQILKISNF